MAAILKKVKVKRTVFSDNRIPRNVKKYMYDCINMGSAAALYKDPNITTAFYGKGTQAADDIQNAMNKYTQAPTKGNRLVIYTKASTGKLWLGEYSDQVEPIANDDANRNTREEAATNIYQSNLTPQKLANAKKGIPFTPRIQATYVGGGQIDVKIYNGIEYQPSQTIFILVEVAAKAIVTLINGALRVTMLNPGDVVTKTVGKKGRYTYFYDLKRGAQYAIYAYAQNGKNQVSLLSVPVYVKM